MHIMELEKKKEFAHFLRDLADALENDDAVEKGLLTVNVMDDGFETFTDGWFIEKRMQVRPPVFQYTVDITMMPGTKEWRRSEPKVLPSKKKKKRKK